MIVKREQSAQLLITQPDHAALAGRIMRRWKNDGLPTSARRSDILLAVEQHDNGWLEVDSSPVIDAATGSILDFVTAPDAIRRGVWPRGVSRLSDRPYAAALVAQHAIHVYDRYRGSAEWQPFFAEMEAARELYLRQTPAATLGDLLEDYFFVRIGDLISLMFCNGWTDDQTDPSGYVARLSGSDVTITRDPFGGSSIPLEVPARRLPRRPFTSLSAAHEAFRSAPSAMLTGTVSGAPRREPPAA